LVQFIGKPQFDERLSAVTDLFADYAILLGQVKDGVLLTLIDPTGKATDHERNGIVRRGHTEIPTSDAALFSPAFSTRSKFLHPTRIV
jgi:hypothetical protein